MSSTARRFDTGHRIRPQTSGDPFPRFACDPGAGIPSFMDRLGFDRADIIEMATTTSAEALGIGNTTGQLAPGLSADLLVTAGDPLADLVNLRALQLVVVRGQSVSVAAE